jgi:beta-lactamase class A
VPDRHDRTSSDRTALAARLAALVAAAPAPVSVSVGADDGWVWQHDAERVVPAASTIKVPVLLAVLRLVEQGRLHLADSVPLPAGPDRVGGAGPLSLLPSVTHLPLLEALRLMVAVSDNDASNAVLDHARLLEQPGESGGSLGVLDDPVGELLAAAGTRHTGLRRRFMDLEAAAAGRQNETCAADLAALLAGLRQGRLLGAEMTALAVELLRQQQSRAGLPAYLPDSVLAASKPGDLPGVRTEVALLERDGRWVVVAAVADGLADDGVDRGTAVLPTFAALGALAATVL